MNPITIEWCSETNSQIFPHASMCLCFEVKDNVFCWLLEMGHTNILSYSLVCHCFIFQLGSIMSPIKSMTLGFPMNLFGSTTFYCLFELSQHCCIRAVEYIIGINNTNVPLTYCLFDSNKPQRAVYLRNFVHFTSYYKNSVHEVTSHFPSVWSICIRQNKLILFTHNLNLTQSMLTMGKHYAVDNGISVAFLLSPERIIIWLLILTIEI